MKNIVAQNSLPPFWLVVVSLCVALGLTLLYASNRLLIDVGCGRCFQVFAVLGVLFGRVGLLVFRVKFGFMLMKFGKVLCFVREYLMETGKQRLGESLGPKYRWEHTLRVTGWAWRLAVEEEADVEKCVVAALMHDVSHFDSEDYRKHGIRSAEIAKEFLLKEAYPRDFVEDVAYAVKVT